MTWGIILFRDFSAYWSNTTTWLRARDQKTKTFIIVAADLVFLLMAVFFSYALRVSSLEIPKSDKLGLYITAPALSIAAGAIFGLYNSASRSYSWHVERKIIVSQILVPMFWAGMILVIGPNGFARSVIIIYFILSLLILACLRRLAAWAFRTGEGKNTIPQSQRIKTAIYGAGQEGILLAENLVRQGRYAPIAFIDTDYTLVGRTVAGLRVYSTEHITEVITKFRPTEVMVAKPHQNRKNRRTLVEMFISHGLQVKTIPNLDEIVDGKIDVNTLRPVKLEDLLGRDPVPPDKVLMDKAIRDQVVMVTGAGGSIGSELVRQASAFGPRKLVLVDNNEFSLFEIHREIETKMLKQAASLQLVPLLADVQEHDRMSSIMAEHQVTVVLHAAAYKHVRMVQENAAAGIRNNVFGTKSVAEAAVKNGVELFILISTDKAVRPTSIMGATKRVAEMVVQAIADKAKTKTTFAIVRFGNVLGSTGSVIPLFQEQISKGGPVLVTHPDVTRFFMLIPEAAQLVIQAGAMAEKCEVFVLEMGEPVKIANLAETMIELAGMSVKSDAKPDGDMEIKFSGLRDGEKLYEELQIGRDISTTSHERIMRSNEFFLPWPKLKTALDILKNSNLKSDARIKELFRLALLDS
jgi:UDP-N-acetylglucosamine 4,6-dehydratase